MPSQRCFIQRAGPQRLYRFSSFLCVFLQEQISKPAAEALSTQANPVLDAQEESPSEAADETWEEKEDKHSSESDGPKAAPDPAGQEAQSKDGSSTHSFLL